MTGMRDPNRTAVMCYVPIELAAKIKCYVLDKTVPTKQIGGRKLRVKTRPMAMSDLLIALAERELVKQEVLPQFRQWADATLKRNLKRRAAILAQRRLVDLCGDFKK